MAAENSRCRKSNDMMPCIIETSAALDRAIMRVVDFGHAPGGEENLLLTLDLPSGKHCVNVSLN